MRLVVLGQSFMMHQIRKMVGAAVAVCRGVWSAEDLKCALTSRAPMPTPMAPELGLFLDECVFDSYNSRWAAGDHAAVALSGAVGAAAEAFKVRACQAPRVVGLVVWPTPCLDRCNFRLLQLCWTEDPPC